MNQNNSILKWHCYEPSGAFVDLTEAELLQHILVIGSTGSGKTTLLTSAINQLISKDASHTQRKAGLLIIDPKQDGIVEQIRSFARLAGRENDVQVFGPKGDFALDLFAGLESLDDVERITSRLMLGVEQFGGDNRYWWSATQSMITSALVLLIASEAKLSFRTIVEFMRRWFLSSSTPDDVISLAQKIKEYRGFGHLSG